MVADSDQQAPVEEASLRADLAAAFRLAARFGWHESVGNHFSAVLDPANDVFLMNPRWRHFGLISASELLRLDANDSDIPRRNNPPDISAWCIHGAIHRQVPDARVLLHCHPPYTTALACLADPTIYPIDQNTARYFSRVAYDTEFAGMADHHEEGERLAKLLGRHPVLMMGNHGVTVAGPTVAEAFEELYYLERACKTLMLAYSSGQSLKLIAEPLAQQVALSWDAFRGMSFAHFDQLKELLDRDDRSYRQ